MNAAHLLVEIELAHPLHLYRDAFPVARGGFVLDGGDFTLLGAEPVLEFRAFRNHRDDDRGARPMSSRVVVEGSSPLLAGTPLRADVSDPLEVLRALMEAHAVDLPRDRPMPLLGGAVGYVGYETAQTLERLPALERPALGLPDVALFFHDWVLGRSRRTGRTFLSIVGRGPSARAADDRAEQTFTRLSSLLSSFRPVPAATHAPAPGRAPAFVALTPRPTYLEHVRTAQRHIEQGDAFEICLTHRLDAKLDGDPFALFQHLRANNPAPYAAFLDLPEASIVSSSPERFLSLSAARVAESRPIKGTRPRGRTPADDARLAADLAVSAKDRAENTMIVDLVRNDLGRVCKLGSVETPSLFEVERHPTVHQLVSTVRGVLDDDRDAIDLLRACFPPGSMTGAPKIEAMTILERLEPTERGVYSGALGWLDYGGTMDLSVVIRTIIAREGRAHVHVGGAIVSDSEPAAEHEEAMHKARALLEALAAVAAPAEAACSASAEHHA
ncbi:MAG: aminodeoxychorismate synthase component I [Labilithrix sp.]|nr:aminodeoxychorismate synthase component I [Labilithrix sp.]